jgi:hypothetical protein
MQLNETAANQDSLVYTVDQAGHMLGGKGRNFIYQAMASGQLKSFKLGNSRRIAHVDLVAFVNAMRKKACQSQTRRTDPARGAQ